METRLCPVCKTVNAKDADRCMLCGQILDQSADIPESAMPTRKLEPPKAISISKETVGDHDQEGSPKEPQSPEKNSNKLRKLLSSKPKQETLQDLERQGLLLPEDHSPGTDKGREQQLSGGSADEIVGSTLPDWLRSVEFGQVGNQKDIEPETVSSHRTPEPAELPDWVKKLQGNVKKPESGQHDGIPDVSRSGEGIPLEIPKAPAKARPRQVFQAIVLPDQSVVDSLKSYLKGLRNPRETPPDRSGRIIRLSWGVIGLALIGLIAVLCWPGTMVASLPQTPEPSLISINQYIEQLSPESVVLVGIDYDLPLAGELENASLPVITHLMSKQVHLVFLPTRPVGPAMADRLAGIALKWEPGFPTKNLLFGSYLIGGAVGLSRFAIDPRSTLPIGADGLPFWSRSGLERIGSITDFSMVLLITDSLESGRDWIEQIGPWLGMVPMDVVASSQSVPLLQPYVASGQIQSLVAGIVGGADYERMTLMTTNNQLMLRPYRGGLIFMIVLMASSLIVASLVPEKWFLSRKGKRNNVGG